MSVVWSERQPRKVADDLLTRLGLERASLLALAVGLCLAATWFGLGRSAGAASSEADDHRTTIEASQLMIVRAEMTRAQMDEATARMMAPFGLAAADDIDVATNRRLAVMADGVNDLRTIADLDASQSSTAQSVLDRLGRLSIDAESADDINMWDLITGANVTQFDGVAAPLQPPTAADSMQELMWLDHAVLLPLHESIIVEHARLQPPTDPALSTFFSEAGAAIVGTDPWLGPDSTQPLVGSRISNRAAAEIDPATWAAMQGQIIDAGVWDADQWVQLWTGAEATAPLDTIDVLAGRSLNAIDLTRATADARLDSLIDEASAAQNAADRRAWILSALSVAAAIAALACIGFGLWLLAVRERGTAPSTVDPVTGLGGREILDRQTALFVSDPRFSHHAVIAIRLDVLPQTLATHGSLAADRLLEELGRGLQRIVRSKLAIEASAVQLERHEFLVALHGIDVIDISLLRRYLDRLRLEAVDLGNGGASVPLGFRYGVATALGTTTLSTLLEDASRSAAEHQTANDTDHSVTAGVR